MSSPFNAIVDSIEKLADMCVFTQELAIHAIEQMNANGLLDVDRYSAFMDEMRAEHPSHFKQGGEEE